MKIQINKALFLKEITTLLEENSQMVFQWYFFQTD